MKLTNQELKGVKKGTILYAVLRRDTESSILYAVLRRGTRSSVPTLVKVQVTKVHQGSIVIRIEDNTDPKNQHSWSTNFRDFYTNYWEARRECYKMWGKEANGR